MSLSGAKRTLIDPNTASPIIIGLCERTKGHGLQRTQRRNPRQYHADAAGVGSTTRGVGYCAPLQRNAFRQRLCLVLAKDCRRADFKTSLVDYRLRLLRHGG